MHEQTVKVALLGFGVVGAGVARIIRENAELIAARSGVCFELAHVVVRDPSKPRDADLPGGVLHTDLNRAVSDPQVALVVELIGGVDQAAEVVKQALNAGKPVVTANKALLAERGQEIYDVAHQNNTCVAFEASCCGGIPVIGAIRTGLAANRIQEMVGIVNGTCNFILSSMSDDGMDYASALAQAQRAGYAEADPTLDVNGADSAHKMAIMAALAFGRPVPYDSVRFSGIESVDIREIAYGRELGYTLKLLGVARGKNTELSVSVRPTFVSDGNPLALVKGAFNAVGILGQEVGPTLFYGQGAGRFPTASAVVADMIEVARGNSQRLFETTCSPTAQHKDVGRSTPSGQSSRFYLRLTVLDESGVLGRVTTILGEHGVSIMACIQHEMDHPETQPLIITTHVAPEARVDTALTAISELDAVRNIPVCIPILSEPDHSDQE